MKCETCPNAIWDCCEFYGATRVQKVVIGCKLDKTPEECEEKDKQCGEVGTISLDDFEEWGEENISDLCDYLIQELQKGE